MDNIACLHARARDRHRPAFCIAVVDTSFNLREEPMEATPEDVFRCFLGCGLETLVVGNRVLQNSDQDPELRIDHEDQFEPD